MELTTPARPSSFLPGQTHSCRVSVILLSSPPFSSFAGRASAGTFTLFASCLLPRLVRCRSALAAMFSDAAPESNFVYFRRRPVIDSSHHRLCQSRWRKLIIRLFQRPWTVRMSLSRKKCNPETKGIGRLSSSC